MWSLRECARTARVVARQAVGLEPVIRETASLPLEFHGGGSGGWSIVRDSLTAESIVVDVGLGEDASFSESIASKYGCVVSGFDPTPRAISYVKNLNNVHLKLFEFGLGTSPGPASFFLPNNEVHVSGSLHQKRHLGKEVIKVELVTIGQVFDIVRCDRIDLLKLDIEGTEFDIIGSAEFARHAGAIGQLCVEFHHRWEGGGKRSTEEAASVLQRLGFRCAWYSRPTNQEFLFIGRSLRGTNHRSLGGLMDE